jgi:ribosomal 50S subunit-recycling heat shock protein
MRKLIIGKNDAGQRLDKFISKAVKGLPMSLLYKDIRTKRIKVNGARAKENQILAVGDEITLFIRDEFFDSPEKDDNALANIKPKLSIVYEDENIRVAALHNRHLREDGTNGWHSFSFLVECEGKRIVLSGDVASPEELLPLMVGGCDLLSMETGHHKVLDVCEFAKRNAIPRLRFTHHGREILGDRDGAERLIESYPFDIRLAFDGMIEEL